jgi:hypothetical protein
MRTLETKAVCSDQHVELLEEETGKWTKRSIIPTSEKGRYATSEGARQQRQSKNTIMGGP